MLLLSSDVVVLVALLVIGSEGETESEGDIVAMFWSDAM
jgi:hypothetical protein